MAAVPLDTDSSEEYGVGMELECDEKFSWHVAGVRPDGPAAAAGITRGDMLRAVDWTLVKVNRPRHFASTQRRSTAAKRLETVDTRLLARAH